MSWQPSTLTTEQKTERRLAAGDLFEQGELSQHAIALELGVSDAAISKWHAAWQGGGLAALAPHRATGRPPKLTLAQQKKLVRLLQRGALVAGFPTERWTQARVRALILRQFGIAYHSAFVGRLLHRLGWTVQLPESRARERDEAAIRAWLRQDWPRIKKSAAAWRRDRV